MAEMSWLRRIAGKRDETGFVMKSFGGSWDRHYSQQDQQKKTDMVWTCGENGRQKITSKSSILLRGWKRSRGRQTKTWMENVRQDLVEKDMDLRTALNTIGDRGRWRHLVKPHRR